MKYFYIICTFVLLILGIQLQAEESSFLNRYLTRLDHVEFQSDTTFIHLNNGTVYSNTLSSHENEMLRMWNAGDRINISVTTKNQGSLLLENIDSCFVPVTLKLASQQNLLTVEKIEKIRNLKYACIKVFAYTILLSDGSFWICEPEPGFDHDLCSWNEGDHILISCTPSNRENNNEPDFATMINCDLIQTKKYNLLGNYFKLVSPFTLENFKIIRKIETRQKHNWDTTLTAFLTLSDGSCWEISLRDEENKAKLETWLVGNRVIVDKSKSTSKFITNYDIISTDINSDASVFFMSSY